MASSGSTPIRSRRATRWSRDSGPKQSPFQKGTDAGKGLVLAGSTSGTDEKYPRNGERASWVLGHISLCPHAVAQTQAVHEVPAGAAAPGFAPARARGVDIPSDCPATG